MNSIIRQRAEQLQKNTFLDLLYEAHQAHRQHHPDLLIQRCKLLSIKTGGCPEDCGYCPQSAHHKTETSRHALLSLDQVKEAAEAAKAAGAQRFCMGAAWRGIKDGSEFELVLKMVKIVKSKGLEACLTLGLMNEGQAERLKEAGLDAYNHNLDTSRSYYPKIITTRKYEDRLETIRAVRKAGIFLCCGGIIGMGESAADRLDLLAELASLDPPPESVPINLLIPVPGTPLGHLPAIDPIQMIRTVAIARILMPKSMVRLSAGRLGLSREAQILAFFAGANSIFIGEKLLTRDNPHPDDDSELLNLMNGHAHLDA